MASDVSPEAAYVMDLEERAHRIRMDILSRPGLLERLRAAREACERGEGISLAELERQLSELDHQD
jgi:hypothetical protein